jgi:PrtD family type I secretion system ABC transporter
VLNDLRLFRPIHPWLITAGWISLCVNALQLASPIYMLQIYDRVLVSRSIPTLLAITLITVVLVAAYGLLDLIRTRLLLRAGLSLERKLGTAVMEKAHALTQADGNIGAQGELMRDVSNLRNYVSSTHLMAIFDSPWVPLFTLLIFGFSWVLGVITLIGMLMLIGLALIDERYTFARFTQANQRMQGALSFSQTTFANAEAARAMGMQPALIRLWQQMLDEGTTLLKKAADLGSHVSGATKVIRILIQVAMLGAGAYLVIVDNLQPGVMIAATIIVARAIGPIEQAISGWRTLVEVRNSASRVAQCLAIDSGANRGEVQLPPLSGELVAEGLHFAFGPGKPLLGNVSFKIAPGEVVGIVGASGTGKTSLIRMLLGVAKPLQGRILLDGHDLNEFRRESIGPQLGYLPQNIDLYPGTVATNICRMQDPEAHSQASLLAAGAVGLEPVITGFPEGYDTKIAGLGRNLSGGQRQLVGLARAFFGAPRIVVLDEPDASLDQQAEASLLGLIDRVRQERNFTLLIISHSPRIIDRMDRLLLVKDGTVATMMRQTPSPQPALAGKPA